MVQGFNLHIKFITPPFHHPGPDSVCPSHSLLHPQISPHAISDPSFPSFTFCRMSYEYLMQYLDFPVWFLLLCKKNFNVKYNSSFQRQFFSRIISKRNFYDGEIILKYFKIIFSLNKEGESFLSLSNLHLLKNRKLNFN